MSEVENPETVPVKYTCRIKMGRCNCVKNDANPNQPIVNRRPEQGILAVKVEEGVLPNFCWTNRATGEVGLDISGSRQQFELSRVRDHDGEWAYLVKHFEERHSEGVFYAFWLQETETDRNTVEAIRRVIEGHPVEAGL
ncbi:hypothetical protein CRE_01129 [Caenorhabditis remanei]|uniref:Pru domain-containing protein n=1 Tax=Caenorhabditis remanei TaxID=31234 RepID=E3MWL1_CAERE|nr:hypothetical protein CRE_01129 [Caenorhabditis remanei]